MKLNKIILSCALAAGLATVATQTQAGVVIENTLFTPLNVKAVVTYLDSKTGKLKQASVNSKTFLKSFGFTNGDKLAISIGSAGTGDVYVINKNSVVEDLTTGGYVFVDGSDLISSSTGNKNKEKYTSAGTLTVSAYSNPVFSEGFDQIASQNASAFWMEVSGVYAYTETFTAPNKKGKSSQTTNLKADALAGVGFDVDLDDANTLPVTASLSGSGSGTVTAPVVTLVP